jgi:hypothetical protein
MRDLQHLADELLHRVDALLPVLSERRAIKLDDYEDEIAALERAAQAYHNQRRLERRP